MTPTATSPSLTTVTRVRPARATRRAASPVGRRPGGARSGRAARAAGCRRRTAPRPRSGATSSATPSSDVGGAERARSRPPRPRRRRARRAPPRTRSSAISAVGLGLVEPQAAPAPLARELGGEEEQQAVLLAGEEAHRRAAVCHRRCRVAPPWRRWSASRWAARGGRARGRRAARDVRARPPAMIGCSLRHRGERAARPARRARRLARHAASRSACRCCTRGRTGCATGATPRPGARSRSTARAASCAPTRTGCRSTARSPPRRTGTSSTPAPTTTPRGSPRRSTTAAATTGSPCSRSRTGSSSRSGSSGDALTVSHDRRRRRATSRCRSRSAGTRGCRCPACRARSGSSTCPRARRSRSTSASCRPASGAGAAPSARRSADRVLDDHFAVAEDARFAIAGGGREIAVEWAGGYRYAQVFAPWTLDIVCLEPMMAPVAALSDRRGARARRAGRSACARSSRARDLSRVAGVAMMWRGPIPRRAVTDERAPVVRVDVAGDVRRAAHAASEADGSSDAFYSSLCEAVCRLTSMDRAVIFRYDEARRRVRAAGAYGIDLERVRATRTSPSSRRRSRARRSSRTA